MSSTCSRHLLALAVSLLLLGHVLGGGPPKPKKAAGKAAGSIPTAKTAPRMDDDEHSFRVSASPSDQPHLLLIPHPGYGGAGQAHHHIFTRIATFLSLQNYRVTMLADHTLFGGVKRDLRTMEHSELLMVLPYDTALSAEQARMAVAAEELGSLGAKACSALLKEPVVVSFLAANPADVAILDASCLCGAVVADKLNITRRISLMTWGSSMATPFLGLGWELESSSSDPLERVAEWARRVILEPAAVSAYTHAIDQLRHQLDLPPSLKAASRGTFLLPISSVMEPISTMSTPKNIQLIGPVSPAPAMTLPSALDSFLSAESAQKRGSILVSLSDHFYSQLQIKRNLASHATPAHAKPAAWGEFSYADNHFDPALEQALHDLKKDYRILWTNAEQAATDDVSTADNEAVEMEVNFMKAIFTHTCVRDTMTPERATELAYLPVDENGVVIGDSQCDGLRQQWLQAEAKLAKIRDGESLGIAEGGEDIQKLPWVPQNDILAHRRMRLFVSDGGRNGIYEALYQGVPVLCVLPEKFRHQNHPMQVARDALRVVMHTWLGKKVFLPDYPISFFHRQFLCNHLEHLGVAKTVYATNNETDSLLITNAARIILYKQAASFLLAAQDVSRRLRQAERVHGPALSQLLDVIQQTLVEGDSQPSRLSNRTAFSDTFLIGARWYSASTLLAVGGGGVALLLIGLVLILGFGGRAPLKHKQQ